MFILIGEGFYVYVLCDLVNFGDGYIFVYDVLMMNLRDGYNIYMGIFMVFVDGLYLLLWVIRVLCSKLYIS